MKRAYDAYQKEATEPFMMLTQNGWVNLDQPNRYMGLRIQVGDFIQEVCQACGAEKEVINEIKDTQRI
jgi:hypothetical protein